MIISDKTRSGNKDVDSYIEALENELHSYQASNSKQLIRSIDGMAKNISDKLVLIAKEETNGDGTEVELSSKNVDIYLKMVDKADKIENFIKLVDSMGGSEIINTTTTETTVTEKKVEVKNMYEEMKKKIKT